MMSSYSNGNEMRDLVPGDYDAILSVWDRAGLSSRPLGRDSPAEVRRQMTLDPGMWLGCFSEGCLVGLVMGSYDSRKGWLNRLAVVPEFRRKGVARALVEEMEGRLKARGLRIICVLIDDNHDASESFFLGRGYAMHHDITYFTKREGDEV